MGREKCTARRFPLVEALGMVNWAALDLKLRSSDPGPRARRPRENEVLPRLCSMFLGHEWQSLLESCSEQRKRTSTSEFSSSANTASAAPADEMALEP